MLLLLLLLLAVLGTASDNCRVHPVHDIRDKDLQNAWNRSRVQSDGSFTQCGSVVAVSARSCIHIGSTISCN